ncbi:MAG: Maf family protein [Synergistaceae bacterium]|jgi:septum formation protein|nr:Maf family protein [Synergistaceae bacterium]
MTIRFPRLALASNSPRRREIFSSLGWSFEALSPDIDETRRPGEPPRDMALRLAEQKAVAASADLGLWTVGADTVVDVDGLPLGKPVDRDDSLRMLHLLSGRAHLVHTGVAVASAGKLLVSGLETTRVFFGDLSDEEIRDFADSGCGCDKAGAYAIQGKGALLVERLEGCYYNVVGLPVYKLASMLKNLLGKR